MTDGDDVVTSVEERRRVVVVQVAGLERRLRAERRHVVLHPLPHVASHVVEPLTVARVPIDRLSITRHVTRQTLKHAPSGN